MIRADNDGFRPISPERSALLEKLADRIAGLCLAHPIRVGVDGVDAAGKTTLADELAERLAQRGRSVLRAGIDSFHRPAAARYRRGADSPEGYYRDSFDFERLVSELLAPLGPGGSRCCRLRVFDHLEDRPVETAGVDASQDAVLLFDGVFLQRPELAGHWDLRVFVRVDFAETQARAERRDLAMFGSVAEIRRRYAGRYVPGQRHYLEECRPEANADLVVDNQDPARPFLVGARRTGGPPT